MNDYMKQLDTWFAENPEKVYYGTPLTEDEIKRFETINGCVLPEDLRTFYKWNNGIKTGNNFQFLSLEEAFHFYQNETREISTATAVDEFGTLSLEEARLFQEEFKKYSKTVKKEHGFWLPLFVEHRPAVSSYYAIWLSEIDIKNPNWVLINTRAYPHPFYFKLGRTNIGEALNFYSELPAVLADTLNRLNPPETSFRQGVKHIFHIIGSFFER